MAAAFDFLPTGKNANGYFNGLDIFLPGSTLLDNLFDPTGQHAAAQQAESNWALQKDAQAFNSAEAQKAREFEKEQSDTAIQRMKADYEAAGINPMVAFMNGGTSDGAHSASGQAASSGINSVSMAQNKMALFAGIVATAARMLLTKH